MDPTIPTPTVCSTVTTSSISAQAPPPTPFQILEISLISAQDLVPISKSMRTYAVAWIQPNKKRTTRTDHQGHTNPTWNEKFAFRMDNETLVSETAMVTVEIYTISWFRDVLVGTVSVLMSDLITPAARTSGQNLLKNTRFVALQVRRPSGNPQGILNMGVALLDSTMRSMPLRNYVPPENFRDEIEKKVNSLKKNQEADDDHEKEETNPKVHLWRSLSVGSELNNEDFPQKPGLVYNGSMVNGSILNGSELCSDIGPSASIVAAEIAKKLQPASAAKPSNGRKFIKNVQAEETGSSIVEDLTIEEARAKGYRITTTRDRWRKQMSMRGKNININDDDFDGSELSNNSRHSRRNSDGGLFSCFGNAYGIEFTIVCGASNNTTSSNNNNGKSRRKKPSEANSAP